MKKKAKVAANRTPKVRRPSLLERIEETEDFMSNFDEELGKLQTSNGALANRISAIEALPDVDALAKRVGALECPSPLLLDIEKKVAELEAAERIFKKCFHALGQGFFPEPPAPKDAVAGPLPSTPNPSPAKITPPTPAPIAPRCPHGLAGGFFAMGEPSRCIHLGDKHEHHFDEKNNAWSSGNGWDRILVNGVWTRP